jgi:hypothetical protein
MSIRKVENLVKQHAETQCIETETELNQLKNEYEDLKEEIQARSLSQN